jgi:hypothetical protein
MKKEKAIIQSGSVYYITIKWIFFFNLILVTLFRINYSYLFITWLQIMNKYVQMSTINDNHL